MAPRFWRQVRWTARKDLRTELRGGETLWMVTPFGALALLLAPVAIGTGAGMLRRIGPGMLWLVVLLFGMMVTLRSTAADPPPIRDLLRLSGLHPAPAFLGRSLASGALLLGFTLVMTPVMIVFYSPDRAPSPAGWLALAGLSALAAAGIALLGSLAVALTAGLRSRTALAPLLTAPPAIPVLMAGASGTNAVLDGGGNITLWLLLLAAMNLALAIVGILLAHPLEEAAA